MAKNIKAEETKPDETSTVIDPKFCPGDAASNDPVCGATRATITEAIADAATAGVAGRIYIESGTFTESINISEFKVNLMLLGGWDVAANTRVGTSTINGLVNVSKSTGVITFENIVFARLITISSSNVAIKGTTSSDAIQVNLSDSGSTVSVDGGGGGDTVTVNVSGGGGNEVNISDSGSGGGDTVVVNGTPSTDVLTVANASITHNSGEIININGFETLRVNGGDGDDALVVDLSGSTTVPSDGLFYDGGGGFDVMSFQGGSFNSVVYRANGPSSGTVQFDGALVNYANIEPITDTSLATDVTFSGTIYDDTISILDGTIENGYQTILIQSGGTFESIKFANKTNVTLDSDRGDDTFSVNISKAASGLRSLTINDKYGGDRVTINSFSVKVALSISLDDEGKGDDYITITSDMLLNGENLKLTAETVTVNSNVTISTRNMDGVGNSTGDSGDITITGEKITIKPGAQLLAHVETGSLFKAGNITVSADATDWTGFAAIDFFLEQFITPWFGAFGVYVNRARVEIDGATLKGKDIVITSDAEYTPEPALGGKIPYIDQYQWVDLLKGAANFLFGGDLGLPFDFVVAIVSAKVTVKGNSQITGSGSVKIKSTAEADGSNEVLNDRFSVTFGYADAEAKISIEGTSTINAGGSVLISSNAKSKVELVARTSTDASEHQYSASLSISITDVTSWATVAQGVTITSGENVNVEAKGNNTSVSKAEFKIFRHKDDVTGKFKDGSAGLTIGLAVSQSDIKAEVDGTVTAAGAPAGYKISPATDVVGATDTITWKNHGLKTGDTLTYNSGGGTAIGGLDDGEEYFVIVLDADHFQLAKGAPIDLNNSGVGANAQHSLSPALTKEFALSGVNVSTDTITLTAHGFTNGQKVTYAALGDEAIDGLTDG